MYNFCYLYKMEIKIPLVNRIKRESHRNIAFAQDLIIEEIYKTIPKAVLHGGTCIWRCYFGRRFSEDLDFYFPKEKKDLNKIFENLRKMGFEIIKKKISDRSLYSELKYERTFVRLEATFQKIPGSLINYEKINGTTISIYGLLPEQLIKEKILTYLKRKKIRDLYDISFLLKYIKNFKLIQNNIKELIENYSPPIDKTDLKTIIFEGIAPSNEDLIKYIKRKWENPNI